jgi:S-adenosylmethionine:tRNA ribosyltransferase-isomerase
MRVDLFDFHLPAELIALRPAKPRDSARLLLVEGDRISDRAVRDLPTLLGPGDVLVFNDTRVIPAQLEGRRGEASIGATLHKREGQREWWAFVRNAKRVRDGDLVEFGGGVSASAVERDEEGAILLHFHGEEPVELLLERAGRMPLPPYIASRRPADEADRHDYQTMFAREEGAVAAPTAALHFTPGLIAALEKRGVGSETLTLHVGAGTFLPVKSERIEDHKMHAEWGRIDAETAGRLNAVRASGGRLISVGTTSLRLLESAADEDGTIHPFDGDTAIFITPGYRFNAIDGLVTNFHLPKSTLFMLVSALMGLETMKAAYAHAVEQRYRFYSYGDASLLLPQPAK